MDQQPGPVEKTVESTFTRRRMMQAVSAGTAMFIAGCGGGGTDTEQAGNTESIVDQTFKVAAGDWMNEANLNIYAPDTAAGSAWQLFPPLALFSTTATFNPLDEAEEVTYNEYRPLAASDWSFEGDEMSITLHDDWQWTSGDEVTSADLALRFRILEYTNDPIWNYMDAVREEDEKTVVLELKKAYDQEFIKQTLFAIGQAINTPKTINGEKSEFAKIYEEMESASTQSEEDEALESLNNFNWHPNDAVFSGPWKLTNLSKSEMILERHEGFYNPVNFSNMSNNTHGIGQASSAPQALSTGDLETTQLPAPEVVRTYSDDINVIVAQGTSGIGYALNYEDPGGGLLQNRNLHRAIAYVLSSERASKNSNELRAGAISGPGAYTGMFGASAWLSEDTLSQLDNYERDTEKAASLLRDEGFTKQNDSWVGPDGEELTLEVNTAPWHVWPALGQTVVGTLNDFGVNTTLNALGSSSFANTLWGTQGYQTSMSVLGAAHPVNAYDTVFGEDNIFNTPPEIEVPMPIGDPQGSLETINVRERTSQLADLSGDELRSEVETLAWAFNQTLPVIPLVTENGGLAYSEEDWNYPDREDPIWGAPRGREAIASCGLVSADTE